MKIFREWSDGQCVTTTCTFTSFGFKLWENKLHGNPVEFPCHQKSNDVSLLKPVSFKSGFVAILLTDTYDKHILLDWHKLISPLL